MQCSVTKRLLPVLRRYSDVQMAMCFEYSKPGSREQIKATVNRGLRKGGDKLDNRRTTGNTRNTGNKVEFPLNFAISLTFPCGGKPKKELSAFRWRFG